MAAVAADPAVWILGLIAIVFVIQKHSKRSPMRKCVIPRDVLLKYCQYTPVRRSKFDDAAKATDNAEASTTDFSDGLEQITGSTDGSDAESSMLKMISALNVSASQRQKPERRGPVKAPMGMKAPPGLIAPPGLETPQPPRSVRKAMSMNDAQSQESQRQKLSSGAPAFVPSFGATEPAMEVNQGKSQELRSSIRMLKGVLEEWETGLDGQQQHNMSGLQDALSKLNPQEVAMVTAFLDSQQMQGMPANVCPGTMQAPAFQYGQPVYGQTPSGMSLGWPRTPAWAGGGTSLPFTPFTGASQFRAPIGGKQQSKFRKPEVKASDNTESLSTHLRDLAALDSARVIMVRKINHLSGDAVDAIKTYFAKFGTVERVMASPTRSGGKPGRVRPATMGFLVMGTAEEAKALLDHGAEHVIDGVTVLASTFQSHAIDEKPN